MLPNVNDKLDRMPNDIMDQLRRMEAKQDEIVDRLKRLEDKLRTDGALFLAKIVNHFFQHNGQVLFYNVFRILYINAVKLGL